MYWNKRYDTHSLLTQQVDWLDLGRGPLPHNKTLSKETTCPGSTLVSASPAWCSCAHIVSPLYVDHLTIVRLRSWIRKCQTENRAGQKTLMVWEEVPLEVKLAEVQF